VRHKCHPETETPGFWPGVPGAKKGEAFARLQNLYLTFFDLSSTNNNNNKKIAQKQQNICMEE
jgi:hypothetical protein